MVSRDWRNGDDIIITGASIPDNIWYAGAITAYAEIQYTMAGEESQVLHHNSENMDIFWNPAPANDYRLDVVYYDNQGN